MCVGTPFGSCPGIGGASLGGPPGTGGAIFGGSPGIGGGGGLFERSVELGIGGVAFDGLEISGNGGAPLGGPPAGEIGETGPLGEAESIGTGWTDGVAFACS